MKVQHSIHKGIAIAAAALLIAGCARHTTLEPWPHITTPTVYTDGFTSDLDFQAFAGSKLDAMSIDSTTSHTGTTSIKIIVPAPGSTTGTYAGGAFVTRAARDLSGYNALSFWVKASRPVTLDVAGLGNDNTGTSRFTAQRANVAVTTSWTQVFIAIPRPSRLTYEKGLFFFAEGPQSGAGLTMWFDDVEFVNIGTISNPRPVLAAQTIATLVGATVNLQGSTKTTFKVGGVDQVVTHMPGYFTFTSSNTAVATVGESAIRVLGTGTALVTAKLDTAQAVGTITLNVTAPPSEAAPTPTLPASSVVSLFSGPYTSVPVDTWSASWDVADESDISIAGNPTKVYTNLTYAGIECTTHPIDASAMTAFHTDIWVPTGTTFKVKLVDFGADGAYGGGDDSESELTFNAGTTPALVTGSWVSLDIPLANFTTLTARSHIAQLILSGDTKTVYVDNVYFHQ